MAQKREKEIAARNKLADLERIDNDKGYYKENCRWVSRSENTKRSWEHRKRARTADELLSELTTQGANHVT